MTRSDDEIARFKANFEKSWGEVVDQDTLQLDHQTLCDQTLAATLELDPRSMESLQGYEPQRDIKVKAVLGEGGMGVVWLADQVTIGREVAVKKIHDEKVNDTASQELLREAWITGRLEHPNIIPVHSLGLDEERRPLFVMKRVEGVSWHDAIEDTACLPECYEEDDPLEIHLEIFEHVCRAVHFAHSRGILHRDIKPDNVMIGSFGEVYLVDWGIAIAIEEELEIEHGIPSARNLTAPAGTPYYMAPEMASVDNTKFGPCTDVYLLGATLHYALTRQPRHIGADLFSTMFKAFQSDPYEYGPDIPPMLGAICNKATSKEPVDRYQSAEELRRAVAEFRRHRAAHIVEESAQESLQEFQEMATRGDELEKEEVIHAHRLYGECRFGFEQALEIWPENDAARRGIQDTLHAMLSIELDQENLSAARALLHEIESPATHLTARLDALATELESKQRHIARLERERAQNDPRNDRRQRGLAMVLLALTLAAINVTQIILQKLGVFTLSDWSIFVLKVLDLIVSWTILGGILWRVKLNRFGKNMIQALGLLFAAGVFIRFGALIQDIPTEKSIIFESIFYAIFCMGVGLFSERRLILLGPLCLLSGIGSYFLPEYSWPIRLSVNLTLLACIGVLWTLRGGDEVASKDLEQSA